MTPVFACGFECGQFGTVGQHWSITGSGAISTSTVNNGARSLRINPTAGSAKATSNTLPNSGLCACKFYIRFATLPGANVDIFSFGGFPTVGVFFKQSDSKLYPGSGTSALGASGISVTTGVWYRIDFYADITGTTYTVKMQVDGVAVTDYTVAGTGLTSTTIILGNNAATGTFDAFYDDVVFSNTLADYPFGFGFVNHFIPTSDGAHNTGTAGTFITGAAGANITNATTTSFGLIDEVPLDDTTPDTNDYINQAGNGATNYVEHVFGPASGISTPTYAPRAVEVIVGYHQAGTGAGVSAIKINDNGTEDNVWAVGSAAGVTTTRYTRKHYALAPTGGAWTVVSGAGNFNNLRSRFGYSSDANPDQFFDCAMVEAEFGPAPAAPSFIPRMALMGVG